MCDEKVIDEDGFLSNSMMVKAKNTLMKELDQLRGQRVCVSAVYPDTDSSLHEELNLHFSLQLDITDGVRFPLNLLSTSSVADRFNIFYPDLLSLPCLVHRVFYHMS